MTKSLMPDFNPKKLQVFVSSTYKDLKAERQAAVEAVLTAGHIPAGMELFTAGDESQMTAIKQWIDESDVFLLILGARYGTLEQTTGKSYVQLEYEYAISKSKRLFACVLSDGAVTRPVTRDWSQAIETENAAKLREFRAIVLSKMCRFWDDDKDIKLAVMESLAEIARDKSLVGWVRPTSQSDLPALADEIARLSKENADLRGRLTQFEKLLQEGQVSRPKKPNIDGYSEIAQKHPRIALQRAWEYTESVVDYTLFINGLPFGPELNIEGKLAALVAHGDVDINQRARIRNELYLPCANARGMADFKMSHGNVMATIQGLMKFCCDLLACCDALEQINKEFPCTHP